MILPPRTSAKRCIGISSEFLKFQSRSCWRNDIKNFGGWVCFPKAKMSRPQLAFNVMFRGWAKSVGACWIAPFAAVTFARAGGISAEFRFHRDTFAFANETVFEYQDGHASLRNPSATKRDAFNRHCFVMSRTAAQFKKFARFEPQSTPLDDASLTARIRDLTRQSTWSDSLPENQRIVFPGYKDLKEM